MKRFFRLFFSLTIIIALSSGLTYSVEDDFLPEEILVTEKTSVRSDDNPELQGIVNQYQGEKSNYIRYKKKHDHPLHLFRNDIRLEKGKDSEYYDLIIRKKKYINSILLTNYYWEVNNKRVREYGLRSLKYNIVNGDEKRLYKKIFIGKNQGLYFLVDSSAEHDSEFGLAFRIRIPKYVVYGYRKGADVYGILKIQDGIKLNIRTFNRKYSDYKGSFRNNPIVIAFKDRPLTVGKEHPVIVKIKELLDEDFLGVHVQFQSKKEFFKGFLVRAKDEKNFKEISFNNEAKEHRRAELLEAFYKGGVGRIIKAVIYFRRGNVPKTYYISAIDKSGLHAVGRLEVTVPALPGNKTRKSSEETYEAPSYSSDEEFWYNEGDY